MAFISVFPGFTPEAGFGWSGNAADGQTFTITQSSGFGTKAQAAAKIFDTFEKYYDNGVVTTPYSALNDGDTIPSAATDPFDTHTGVWTKDVAGRYGKREAAYKSEVDTAGGNIDYWLEGWLGWPAAPSGINDFYARWYLWVEEGNFFETFLDGAHSSAATNITVIPGLAKLSDASPAPPIIIVLNDGSFHRTTQDTPKISTTNFDIVAALPEAANSGNSVYVGDSNDACKHIRVWDVDGGADKTLRLSYTWQTLAAGGENSPGLPDPTPRAGGAGIWNLLELLVHCVTDEADILDGTAKGFMNNAVNGDISGSIQKTTGEGGIWPFDGIIPRLIGMDAAAASVKFKVPNNFLRLAEIYADTTPQRIEIGDHATDLFQSTIREVCPIKGWVDGEVKFIINQGRHPAVSGAYPYFVDETNSATLMGRFN